MKDEREGGRKEGREGERKEGREGGRKEGREGGRNEGRKEGREGRMKEPTNEQTRATNAKNSISKVLPNHLGILASHCAQQ